MNQTLEELTKLYCISQNHAIDIGVLNSALLLIAKIQEEGATFLLKIDGERESNYFTLMISGGRLGNDYLKQETSDLEAGLTNLVSEYAALFWTN